MASFLGVFDSGVGGLTVAHALLKELPGERLLYFADTGYVPYGSRPLDEIRRFALDICRYLAARGAKAIVMGCNMSSAVALDAAREALAQPVWGTIEAGARAAVRASRGGRIGVAATEGTVRSNAYPDAVGRLSPEATVVQAACPALVPLIEAGVQDGEALAAVQESLQPLLAADVDTLIFGCTHYPLLRAQFRSALGDQVALVDPAHEVARQAAEGLRSLGLVAPATPAASAEGAHVLLASGPTAELERQARIWLPGPCEGPHVLDLHGGQTDVATSV